MTVQHSALTGAELHEPKGVAAAGADQVYVSDGAGSGAWTDVATVADSLTTEVIVRSASDFPTPVADVITLAADTVYILDGDIDVGNDRFVFSSNSAIRGLGGEYSSITTTSTGSIFTATTSFHLDSFKLTATTGTVFALTGGSTESAYIRNFTVNSCSSVGSVSSWYSFFWDSGAVVSTTSPLTFSGSCTIMILNLVEFITGYTTAVDLGTATFNTCSFHRCGFGYASATNHVNIAASSANINSGYVGRFSLCTFDAGATNIVNGLDVGDLQWRTYDNRNLINTAKDAQTYMHTPTNTTFSGTSTPTKLLGGTSWVDAVSNQFTVATNGRVTYNGTTPTTFKASAYISGAANSATGNPVYNIYIYVYDNSAASGAIVTASKSQRQFKTTDAGGFSTSAAIITLDTNDWVEIWIENTVNTNSFDSGTYNLIISEI